MIRKAFRKAGVKHKESNSTVASLGIDLISDLHNDRWEGLSHDYAAGKINDIAIVAGDLGRNPEASARELRRIAEVYGTVLFVDGNNEFRDALIVDANPDYQETEERMRAAISAVNETFDTPRIFYLRDQPFIKDGTAVIGRNGHWDFKAALDPRNENPISTEEAMQEHVDVMLDLFTKETSTEKPVLSRERGAEVVEAAPKQARKDFEDLRDEILRLNEDLAIHTIVMVTHTLPYMQGSELLNFPPGISARGMGTMANADLAELPKYDSGGKIKYWFFGHQHAPKNMMIDGIHYIENPRGSLGEIYTKETMHDYKSLSVDISCPQKPALQSQAVKKPRSRTVLL